MATWHEKILVLRPNGDYNSKKTQSEFARWLNEALADLMRIGNTHDAHAIKAKLREILPEYTPQPDVTCVLESTCSQGK